MRGVGAIEVAGALLIARPQTRTVGTAGLAAMSAMMLAVELRNREVELILPRLALTAMAIGAAVTALRAPGGATASRAPGGATASRAPARGGGMIGRRPLLAGAAAAALARPAILRAQGAAQGGAQAGVSSDGPIRIGEIGSYSTEPLFTRTYRMGWQMAVAKVNGMGGLNGRRLEVVSRDDMGRPDTAAALARELLDKEKVDLLAGGFDTEGALAISAVAAKADRVYVAGLPLDSALVWSKGNPVTFDIRASSFMQTAMLVEEVWQLPAKRWASVAPDTAEGRSAVSWFSQQLTKLRPDVRFDHADWRRPVAGAAGAALAADGAEAAPAVPDLGGADAIFCALSGAGLLEFVRRGNGSGMFANRLVVALQGGEPETLGLLAGDTPPGWIVTGYPWDSSDAPFNKGFVADYQAQYHEPPGTGAVVGVAMINAIASGLAKAGAGFKPEALAASFADATFNTPFGISRLRAIDHQSTMGTYVGKTARVNGKGHDGRLALPHRRVGDAAGRADPAAPPRVRRLRRATRPGPSFAIARLASSSSRASLRRRKTIATTIAIAATTPSPMPTGPAMRVITLPSR